MKNLTEQDVRKMSKKKKGGKAAKPKDIVGFEVPTGPSFPVTEEALKMLNMSVQAYDYMEPFRRQTRRSSAYYKGDQWKDIVVVNGKAMTEEQYITCQGRPALKQNLIRPNVRNVIGQLRRSQFKSIVYSRNADAQLAADMMSIALEAALSQNNSHEMDARQFETFLVSGAAVYNTSYSYDSERKMPYARLEKIDPSRYFRTPNATDPNGQDLDFAGDFIDVSKDALKAAYAHTQAQADELDNIYGHQLDLPYRFKPLVDSLAKYTHSPLLATEDGSCRVIRVCHKEGKWELAVHDFSDASWDTYEMTKQNIDNLEAEIARRKRMAKEAGMDYDDPGNRLLIKYEKKYVLKWMYYHISPYGNILWKQECPYDHNSHSYVEKFYPMYEGMAYGMVYDLIDQQRMINRMIIMQDFISSAAAKGVLLVPEDAIPDDMDIEDFADEWSKYNGVIKYKAKDGVRQPEQVVSRQINVGQFDMINLQLKLMNDIGGVHDAIQGKAVGSGTPASLYQQETANAQLNTLDYMESFAWFLMKRDYKMIQIIRQFYDDKQYIQIAGSMYSEEAKHYDPAIVRNYDFYNEVVKSNNTPLARAYYDDMLYNMMINQIIPLEAFLQETDAPFAKSLLKKLESAKSMLQQGQMPTQEQINAMQKEVPPTDPMAMGEIEKMNNYQNPMM